MISLNESAQETETSGSMKDENWEVLVSMFILKQELGKRQFQIYTPPPHQRFSQQNK